MGGLADSVLTIALGRWQRASSTPMSERQVQTLNHFLDHPEKTISSRSWAKQARCSKDTAIRDLHDLTEKNILHEEYPGAKRPKYSYSSPSTSSNPHNIF